MTKDGPKDITTDELFKGKKVVLFSVPGAFTPTCDAKHLPGFVQLADQIQAKGVDTIACMAVNDVFVMNAWGKSSSVGDKILMLADGNGDYAKALGLELDAERLRHGHARPALRDHRQGRRRQARGRRGARTVQGVRRRARPRSALAEQPLDLRDDLEQVAHQADSRPPRRSAPRRPC